MFLSLNNNYYNQIQATKSNDILKSSGSINTTITGFIDIPQDDNQASLISSNGNYLLDIMLDGKLKITENFSDAIYINYVLVTKYFLFN